MAIRFMRIDYRGASNNSGVIENVNLRAFSTFGNEANVII